MFFSPTAGDAGAGRYLPGRFDLHLRGHADLGDRLVHYHEAQHVLLTATTAWGAALLVATEVPGWDQLFGELLDRCRTTHESFATYLSCSAVAAGFGSPEAALAAYPDYVVLVNRLAGVLATVAGAQRRALAATAIARACMQTPVLDWMIASWPAPITMGSVLRIDQPDERFEHLMKQGSEVLAAAAAAADEAVTEQVGPAALEADLADDGEVLDDRFDPAWAVWEDTMFARTADELHRVGATVPSSEGHLGAAAELTERVAATVPGSRLSVQAVPEVAEQRVHGLVLGHARLWLEQLRRPGRFVAVGVNTDCDEVVEVVDATSRVAGRPNLVLSARLPVRLLAGYHYTESAAAALSELTETGEPVVGVRSVADDGTGTDTDAVWFAQLPQPVDVLALTRAWGDRGDLTCCVAASCLLHAQWRERWLPLLREAGPLVWLIDVGVSSLAGEFGDGQTVHGVYMNLGSSPVGARRGVVFKVTGSAGVWLAVADEVGIELLVQEVAALPGIKLQMTGADWTEVLPAVRLVVLDLLHTESYLDLRGHTLEVRP